MNELTPLTSKNGESEWPYENGITLIAVIDDPKNPPCKGCFFDGEYCPSFIKIGVSCTADFPDHRPDVMFIEKPASK
jgi:hypothetical protein